MPIDPLDVRTNSSVCGTIRDDGGGAAHHSPGTLRVERVTTLPALDLLLDEAPELGKDEALPLPLSRAWLRAWVAGFWKETSKLRARSLEVLVVRDGDGIAAVAPCERAVGRYHGVPIRMTRSLSNGSSPWWDLLWRRDLDQAGRLTVATALLDAFRDPLVVLTRLASRSPLRHVLEMQPPSARTRALRVDVLQTPVIDCTRSWDQFEAQLSRKHRKEMRRKIRRFEDAGAVSVDRHLLSSGADPLFQTMVEVSAASWKAGAGRDLSHYGENREFLAHCVDHLGPSGRAELWIARQSGRAIAYELHLRDGDATYPIQADFDERARALSPGSVVEWHALRHAFATGTIERYDSCAADYWYLRRMTPRQRESHTIWLLDRSVTGRFVHAAETRAKPLYRRLRRQGEDHQRA